MPRFTANSTSAGGAFVIKNISNATNDRNLVQRNATDITAAFKTDGSLHIGGSLNTPSSAAPNISLNAAGSINALEGAFTGDTIVPLRVGDPARDKDHGIRIAKNQADVPIYGDIYLTNDGLTFGTGVSTSSIRDANELVQIKNGNVKIGGTLPSAPNISLNASGSATFAGDLFISTLDGGEITTVGTVAQLSDCKTSLVPIQKFLVF